MCNLLKINTLGGGALSLPRTTNNHRALAYIERRLHSTLANLKPDDREDIIFTLVYYWGYSPAELQALLRRSRAQIYRDISASEFKIKRSRRRQINVSNILDYILYNARYIH